MNLFNSTILDQKYITQIGARLNQFKHKGRGIFIARCPICNDSKEDKKKKRFYMYPKEGKYMVYCHNCSYSKPFFTFLEIFDSELYREYNMERFQEMGGKKAEFTLKEEPKNKFDVDLKDIKKVSQLHHNHPAKKYIVSRKIPSNLHHKIYFTEHFGNWVNTLIPHKMETKGKFDPRIILFMKDREDNIIGCQGRSINPKSTLRYITIRFDENFPKIFGLDTFEPNYKGYVLEGPIDSLFIKNALAMTGSDVTIPDLLRVSNANAKRLTFVYDNEPRNGHVVAKMEKTLDAGMKICIWPSSIKSKDVNQMILEEGYTASYITDIIDNNTFEGLQGKLQLATWRKDR